MHNPNPLVKSVIIVVLFWYAVIALFPLLKTWDLGLWMEYIPILFEVAPSFVTHSLKIAALGAITGCACVLILHMMGLGESLHTLRKRRFRGALLTIGDFPKGAQLPKRAHTSPVEVDPKDSATLPPLDWSAVQLGDQELNDWWSRYAQAHPVHARLFAAIDGTLLAYPKTPASPVPGGHGGATLLQHSRSVLKMTLRHAKDFAWVGHRNKKGTITYHPTDATYAFDEADPLIPLVAYAHDIGKIWCYEVQPDGTVIEVRANHATVGAQLFRQLPELWSLPLNERETVNYAIKYYHSISTMPLSIGDHARALAELLIESDIATGLMEGEANIVAHFLDSEGETLTSTPDHIAGIKGALAMSAAPAKHPAAAPQAVAVPMAAAGIAHQLQVTNATTASSGKPLAVLTINDRDRLSRIGDFIPRKVEFRNDIAYWISCLLQLMLDANNLKVNTADRMGIKCDGWVYIFDAELRTRLSKIANFPKMLEQKHEGQISEVTKLLLSAINETGCLLTAINGNRFNAQSSLFNIAIKNKKGGNGQKLRGVFIIHESFDDRLQAIQEERPGSVTVIENLWKTARALKTPIEQAESPTIEQPSASPAQEADGETSESSIAPASVGDEAPSVPAAQPEEAKVTAAQDEQPASSGDDVYDALLSDALAGIGQVDDQDTNQPSTLEDDDQYALPLPEPVAATPPEPEELPAPAPQPEEGAQDAATAIEHQDSAEKQQKRAEAAPRAPVDKQKSTPHAELLNAICERGEADVEEIDAVWGGGKPKDGLDPTSILEHYSNPLTHSGMAGTKGDVRFMPVEFKLSSGKSAKFLRYPAEAIPEIHIEELQRYFGDDLFDNDQAKLKTHTATKTQYLFVHPNNT